MCGLAESDKFKNKKDEEPKKCFDRAKELGYK